MSVKFKTVKAFLPAMLEKGTGHIVSMCSIGSICGYPCLADYCATKFGVFGFMEALQNELAIDGNSGIHFTCILPSFFATALIDGLEM